MEIELFRRRKARRRQGFFEFIERQLRHERWFKRAIVLATCGAIAVVLAALPWGVYLWEEFTSNARSAALQAIGLRARTDRAEIDASWKRRRQLGIDETRPRLERFYADAEPASQRLMRYAAMDPEHALLRWGNFDWTLLLSSKVFEPDDAGRSFRFRPLTHSIWLRELPVKPGLPLFYLVPDEPGLADAIKGTKASVLETSRQFTNTWGLRGPEPDLDAPMRGIILGDSYMQGMFIGDNDTPPEFLGRYLQARLGTKVSMLNTGVMGYSPEQYYYSLRTFADRFKPHFVIVSFFTNDFGNVNDVSMRGQGDWQEGKYWLQQIVNYCQDRHWPVVVVAIPYAPSVLGRRYQGNYPGMLSNILDVSSLIYLDPMDDFIDEHLKYVGELERKGQTPAGCHLFLHNIGDDHFSPAGAAFWADRVGKRLMLLMERDRPTQDRHASLGRSHR